MAIFFIPFVGFIAFLFFGSSRLPAYRRGPFPRRTPADPLTEHFRERSRAKVQLASEVLRQLEFARDLEDLQAARHVGSEHQSLCIYQGSRRS